MTSAHTHTSASGGFHAVLYAMFVFDLFTATAATNILINQTKSRYHAIVYTRIIIILQCLYLLTYLAHVTPFCGGAYDPPGHTNLRLFFYLNFYSHCDLSRNASRKRFLFDEVYVLRRHTESCPTYSQSIATLHHTHDKSSVDIL